MEEYSKIIVSALNEEVKELRKRNILIYIALFVLFVIFVGNFLTVWGGTGRRFTDFMFRYTRGEYDTNISVTNTSSDRCGRLSGYSNGRYYYYDKEKKAFCEYATGDTVLSLKGAPNWIAMSEKYIYYTTDFAVYQYDYEGTEIAGYDFPEGEWVTGMYLEGESLYCECDINSGEYGRGYAVYIFNSEDILAERDQPAVEPEWDETLSCYGNDSTDVSEIWVKKIGSNWLVAESNPDDTKIMHEGNAVKICTHEVSEGGSFSIVSGETGKAIFSYCDFVVAIVADRVFLSDSSEIGSLGADKRWKAYGENLDKELRCSRMRIDGNVWVELLEEYAGGSLGSLPEGSVGEYLNGHLLYIDMESDQVKESIPIKTGQVIYMDKDQYATIKNGKIEFYNVSDGEKIKEHEVKGYQMRKDYTVEVCYDKIFFFCENKLIDVIEV